MRDSVLTKRPSPRPSPEGEGERNPRHADLLTPPPVGHPLLEGEEVDEKTEQVKERFPQKKRLRNYR